MEHDSTAGRCYKLFPGESDGSHSLMPRGGAWAVLQGLREEVELVNRGPTGEGDCWPSKLLTRGGSAVEVPQGCLLVCGLGFIMKG